MLTLLKKLTAELTDGQFLSGHPEIDPFEMERDYPEVEALLRLEQWPFVRGDIEASHAQPRATSFVARKDGRFAGFFLTHAFGDVGYLDMMIVAPEFRGRGVARPLYFRTVHALQRTGVTGLVVHTTNDSAGLIRLLGFTPGRTFTLLARDGAGGLGPLSSDLVRLDPADRAAVVTLDAAVFGRRRETWIAALFRQRGPRFLGLEENGAPAAALALRPRTGGALCLDLVSASEDGAQDRLVERVLARQGDFRFECFARVGSRLEAQLRAHGFAEPDFFRAIGPLVEWRRGRTEGAGNSDRMQCLSWF
jgi:GNAT superfamily N-acetyltransferase